MSTNTYKDNNGVTFTTPHNQPPAFPQPVTVQTPSGQKPGYWDGTRIVQK